MDLLRKSLDKLGVTYTENQINMFRQYYEILIEWNKKMNLTAITDLEDVILKHFVDSLLVCSFFKFTDEIQMIDIGTGAGFPGIPIKILNPDCRIVLLDSLNKRINFLKIVIDTLGLKNIECIHGRAEDVSREKNYRSKFNYSVSRAVANLSTLSEYCIPFLKTGGKFLAYKSDRSDEEIIQSENAVKTLNSEITEIKEILIPDTDIKRKIVIITNKGPVNNRYPRKAGIPLKDPL